MQSSIHAKALGSYPVKCFLSKDKKKTNNSFCKVHVSDNLTFINTVRLNWQTKGMIVTESLLVVHLIDV